MPPNIVSRFRYRHATKSDSFHSGHSNSCHSNQDVAPATRTETICPSPANSYGSARHAPPPTQAGAGCSSSTASEGQKRHNVLIVGDVGAGKSSLVNLICRKDVALTSGGVKSCTLQSQEYIVPLDDVTFSLYDTAGLHEAQHKMGSTEYLDAVHQAYSLISRLEQSGGISLLMFTMKGGRVSITMQQTYNLFVHVFCDRQVPVVIIVTHLEQYDRMEDWWNENEKEIKEYGLLSDGHACITTTRGYKEIFTEKYEESRGVMQNLLRDYSGRVAWKEEKASWVKRMMLHMRGWLSPHHTKQLDGDLRKQLTKRCGFSPADAEEVAKKIEQTRCMPQGDVGKMRGTFQGDGEKAPEKVEEKRKKCQEDAQEGTKEVEKMRRTSQEGTREAAEQRVTSQGDAEETSSDAKCQGRLAEFPGTLNKGSAQLRGMPGRPPGSGTSQGDAKEAAEMIKPTWGMSRVPTRNPETISKWGLSRVPTRKSETIGMSAGVSVGQDRR